MFEQRNKAFWCIVAFVACIPALIRDIPEAYDYLLVITFILTALALAFLQIFSKQRITLTKPYSESRSKLLLLLFAALVMLCLSGLILSGKLVEFRTFYRILAYVGFPISVIGIGILFLNYRKAK
jgi:hypothetical protein